MMLQTLYLMNGISDEEGFFLYFLLKISEEYVKLIWYISQKLASD